MNVTRRLLRVEPLEAHDAPATLVSPTKLTYLEFDGDHVTATCVLPEHHPGTSVASGMRATFARGRRRPDIERSLRRSEDSWSANVNPGLRVQAVIARRDRDSQAVSDRVKEGAQDRGGWVVPDYLRAAGA